MYRNRNIEHITTKNGDVCRDIRRRKIRSVEAISDTRAISIELAQNSVARARHVARHPVDRKPQRGAGRRGERRGGGKIEEEAGRE